MAIGFLGGATGQIMNIWQDLTIPFWVWIALAVFSLVIAQFLAFHRVRIQRDKALESEQSLILTPRVYAFGVSSMTDFPDEPDNADWLYFDVAVNIIKKPIDTLDLQIETEPRIPVDNWKRGIVAGLHAYFNVTRWRWKGEHQVELIAKVEGKEYSSGRMKIDFSKMDFGKYQI